MDDNTRRTSPVMVAPTSLDLTVPRHRNQSSENHNF